MKKLNMESAIKRYNDIMEHCGYEHVTIGTQYSEDTEDWNIRDMVAECDYLYSTYFEDGHSNEELRHLGKEDYALWKSETGRLKRFIEAYEPFIEDVVCADGHCSDYDNDYLNKGTENDTKYWKRDERGYLKAEYRDMAQVIGKFESEQNVSDSGRVTKWSNIYKLYEIKRYVREAQFLSAYETAVKYQKENNSIDNKINAAADRSGPAGRNGLEIKNKDIGR